MRRGLLNLLTALSLLLCVAVCVLWVRSYRIYSNASYSYGRTVDRGDDTLYIHRETGVGLAGGTLYLHRLTIKVEQVDPDPKQFPIGGKWLRFEIPYNGQVSAFYSGRWDRAAAGFGYRAFSSRVGSLIRDDRQVAVPAWCFAAVAAALPLLAMVRRVWRGAHAAGLCPSCGYDLRATPGRCPECGAAVIGGDDDCVGDAAAGPPAVHRG